MSKCVMRLFEGAAQGSDIILGAEAGKTYAYCPVYHLRLKAYGFKYMAPPALFAGGAF